MPKLRKGICSERVLLLGREGVVDTVGSNGEVKTYGTPSLVIRKVSGKSCVVEQRFFTFVGSP